MSARTDAKQAPTPNSKIETGPGTCADDPRFDGWFDM